MTSWADILDFDTTGLEQLVERMGETGEELQRVSDAIDAQQQEEAEQIAEIRKGLAEIKGALEEIEL